jgi:hypothetical protein
LRAVLSSGFAHCRPTDEIVEEVTTAVPGCTVQEVIQALAMLRVERGYDV